MTKLIKIIVFSLAACQFLMARAEVLIVLNSRDANVSIIDAKTFEPRAVVPSGKEDRKSVV